jgi:hypothetical protein
MFLFADAARAFAEREYSLEAFARRVDARLRSILSDADRASERKAAFLS